MKPSCSALPPDAETAATNLSCPQCEERLGVIQLLRHLELRNTSPAEISPNKSMECPICSAWFFPENAFFTCLREVAKTGDSNRSYPFGIAGSQGTNFTSVEVGETRESDLNNLYWGYEIERGSILLQGAHRSGYEEEDWLPIERHEGSYSRVLLGDEVIVAVSQVGPKKVNISASLRETRDDYRFEKSDEITLIYQQNLLQGDATEPPWIQLLREAKTAINQRNPLVACPLLVSAVDNCLYRQLYLYYRWQGESDNSAIERVKEHGYRGKVGRSDLARDAKKTSPVFDKLPTMTHITMNGTSFNR